MGIVGGIRFALLFVVGGLHAGFWCGGLFVFVFVVAACGWF